MTGYPLSYGGKSQKLMCLAIYLNKIVSDNYSFYENFLKRTFIVAEEMD